ncbi:hypothetical protein JB92DRAFT_3032421 [Gautieria morchelliformis]|nr:hypothetical protein JB92DRAFT_3032421 [Gautieria morchelliformis]
MSHVGGTVVIRILWGRRRASDTQSRQRKGQHNAVRVCIAHQATSLTQHCPRPSTTRYAVHRQTG